MKEHSSLHMYILETGGISEVYANEDKELREIKKIFGARCAPRSRRNIQWNPLLSALIQLVGS